MRKSRQGVGRPVEDSAGARRRGGAAGSWPVMLLSKQAWCGHLYKVAQKHCGAGLTRDGAGAYQTRGVGKYTHKKKCPYRSVGPGGNNKIAAAMGHNRDSALDISMGGRS